MTFKPMLANPPDFSTLRFPLLASYKLDGIRATIHDGVAMSRSMKPIPNKFIQGWVAANAERLNGSDGEFIVGEPNIPTTFRTTTSFVMSDDKRNFSFAYYIFDNFVNKFSYMHRNLEMLKADSVSRVKIHSSMVMKNQSELDLYEIKALSEGYEGVMTRDPYSLYKQGRSTAKGQELLKIKRSVDAEACIVSFEERMHNGNEAFTNELGRTARSSHQDNKVGMGTLGSIKVIGLTGSEFSGVEFSIGTGLDDSQRAELWSQRHSLFGKIVKYKYCPIGVKDKPRHPVFLGIRDIRDMDSN